MTTAYTDRAHRASVRHGARQGAAGRCQSRQKEEEAKEEQAMTLKGQKDDDRLHRRAHKAARREKKRGREAGASDGAAPKQPGGAGDDEKPSDDVESTDGEQNRSKRQR